jgi:hypothetical protein
MLGKFINHCEDSLTAAVFTHLLHLPSEVFWRILRQACYSPDLPQAAGEPLKLEWWPKWDPKGTGNNTYIEPDVFIRFREFDLIIEAKRWDDKQQSKRQWQDQLIAYRNEYGEECCPVRMIAIGGLYQDHDELLNVKAKKTRASAETPALMCTVHMCRWRELLAQCKRVRRELKRLEQPDSLALASSRILDDVIGLFGCHGYSTGRWFADFHFDRHQLSPTTLSHHRLFRGRTLALTQT